MNENFRSHESAKVTKLLAGYKVYLTPNVKPEREQMSDIIKCSGGEVFDFVASSSLSPGTGGGGEKVIVVACEEDLALCKDAMESGVTVHSTELILGGVLRQELKLHEYPSKIIYYNHAKHPPPPPPPPPPTKSNDVVHVTLRSPLPPPLLEENYLS